MERSQSFDMARNRRLHQWMRGMLLILCLFCTACSIRAQETYFVTYSDEMEELGNLEISNKSVTGSPKGGNTFLAHALELEYGVKG